MGGPATANLKWVTDGSFLGFVANNSVPIDFVSTHLYPTDGNVPRTRTAFEDMVNETSAVSGRINQPSGR